MEGLNMAAHLVSPDKILEIRTKNLSISIKSKTQPLFGNVAEAEKISTVDITAASLKRVIIEPGRVDKKYTVMPTHVQLDTVPLFFENADYEIIVQSNDRKRVSLWHENPGIRQRVAPVTDGDEHIISGIVNFESSIGLSEFKIIHDGNENVILHIEIFPSKTSYKDDFELMVADISNEICLSAADFLKNRYEWLRTDTASNSPAENLISIVSTVFEGYIKAASSAVASSDYPSIFKMQNFILLSERKITEYTNKKADKVTYNTPKNRFIKYLLDSTAKLFRNFCEHCSESEKLSEMISEIDRIIPEIFPNKIPDWTAVNVMPTVHEDDLAFHAFYRYYLILKSALSVKGDVFKMSFSDTAQLYGYWCFIGLVRIIKNQNCSLISEDVINTSENGTAVNLLKDKDVAVKFINPRADEKISLRYIPSSAEKACISLTVENHSGSHRQYIFAPSYRIEITADGDIGPNPDDIDVMHRYRNIPPNDGESYANTEIRGAYILFPYSDEERYSKHRFYKSIQTANVGGLPFIPDASQTVEKLVETIISESEPKSITLPKGYEAVLSRLDFDECDVLVGSFGSVEQFKDNLENRYYYIPEQNFELERLPIRTIALYQSAKLFGEEAAIRYWGDVTECRRVKRKKIKFPMRRNNPDEWYYVFSIREWNTLPSPIKIMNEGVFKPKYTNIFLLNNTDYSYELFSIHSGKEFRLTYELKYIINTVSENKNPHQPLSYRLSGGETVYIHNGYFNIQRENGEKLFEPPLRVSEISRRLKYYLNLIINKLKQP